MHARGDAVNRVDEDDAEPQNAPATRPSKSARKLPSIAAQWTVYRDFEKLPRLRSAWYLAHYAVRGAIKALS